VAQRLQHGPRLDRICAVTGTVSEVAALQDAVDVGLAWLYATVQPDTAILQHHGVPVAAVGDRRLSFCPAGVNRLPVVVVDVIGVTYIGDSLRPQNPLAAGELEALADLLGRSVPVATTWNGHPAATGSIGLARPAHPSLVAAVARYHARCPQHDSVFCSRTGCSWYRDGNRTVIYPSSGHNLCSRGVQSAVNVES
jgi:hypothetical protein